jgi:hypothetical protein
MLDQDKRIEILRKIENGELSAEDGLRNIRELDEAQRKISQDQPVIVDETGFAASAAATEPPTTPRPDMHARVDAVLDAAPERQYADELGHWKRWWMIPFWVGVAITIGGAALVYWGYTASHFGWGFWLAWLPFIFGMVVMVIGWQSQTSRWLHVRIKQKPGEKPGTIVISMPLPLKLAAWLIRRFGPFIPELREKGLDEILLALEQNVSPEAPFYVNVDNEDGEHVEVFIG